MHSTDALQGLPLRHVVFLAVPPIVELDLLGPLTVFQQTTRLLVAKNEKNENGAEWGYQVTLATAGKDRVIAGENDVQLLAHKHYSEIDHPIDTLLLVGGSQSVERTDPALSDWLRKKGVCARRLGSVCIGVFSLAAAGLLDGRRAATHWRFTDTLKKRYPQIEVDPERIWVKDGAIYTSAGVTAGIDLALAMVEDDLGSRVALNIARTLVVFLKRPGGQRQFSAPLAAQTPSAKTFADLIAWMAENLDKPLSVELLAERMAMSPRNFARVFRTQTGVTPAKYVRRARIEAARAMLEQTRRGLQDIAARCGFATEEVMRRAFIDDVGVAPGQYRATFSTERRRHALRSDQYVAG